MLYTFIRCIFMAFAGHLEIILDEFMGISDSAFLCGEKNENICGFIAMCRPRAMYV